MCNSAAMSHAHGAYNTLLRRILHLHYALLFFAQIIMIGGGIHREGAVTGMIEMITSGAVATSVAAVVVVAMETGMIVLRSEVSSLAGLAEAIITVGAVAMEKLCQGVIRMEEEQK